MSDVVERKEIQSEVVISPPYVSFDTLHSTLQTIWVRNLGPKARRESAHALQLGVGLRRIVRLLKEIETTFGVDVPPTALLRLGTVAAVATAITQGSWPEPSPLVLMKEGDDRPPLYLVAAGSGLVLELCDLAKAVTYPGKVWGLQAPGLDGEAEPLSNLVAIARHYQSAITAHQAEGPYHVVGYSFGGAVALEVARGLAEEQRRLGLVGLIDSNIDERFWPKHIWFFGVFKRCLKRAADARTLPPKQAIEHIAVRAAGLIAYIRRKLRGETAASIHRSSHYIGGFEPNFQRVRDCAITAYETYRPRKANLKLTLFKSELGDPHACDPVPVWRRVTSRLEVVNIPGSHTTMVRPPYAKRLADEIVARLT